MDEEEGVKRMKDYDEKDCNSCIYFDPLKGFCKVHRQEVDPNSEPCEKWKYWDDEH